MKAVKIIVGGILVIVVAVFVMAAIAPTHTHIERSIVIDAPMDFVRPHVSNFDNMLAWSPWAELDPDQKVSFEGEDGTVGASYSWEGNEDVGKGRQVFTAIDANHIGTRLEFKEPFESEADAFYDLEEVEGGTKVTWGFDSESPFPMNAMNLFIDMDEMLGPDYEKGLKMLNDRVAEMKAERKEFGGFTVMVEEMPMRNYIGTRATIGWDGLQEFYATNLPNAYAKVSKAELEIAGSPSGVYFVWDNENQTAELLAGIPVASGSVEGMDEVEAGGKCLVIDYYGDYEGSGKAHEAMEEYMKWHSVEFGGVAIEEYVTDPEVEPDTKKWLTRVIYPVKA